MKKNKYSNFIKGIICTFTLCFIIPFFMFYLINNYFLNEYTFGDKFSVCGVDLSGLTNLQAQQKLENELESKSEINLKLVFGDKSWTFDEQDFEVKSNIHTVLDELQKSPKKHGFNNRAKLVRKIKAMGFDNKVATNYVFSGIDEKINNIANELYINPISARLDLKSDSTRIVKEIFGKELDKEKLYADISNAIQTNNLNTTIQLYTNAVEPEFLEKDIKNFVTKQAQFSTNFGSSNKDRKNNIKVAVKNLNNYEILPNEVFSFNEVLGKRTSENGYREANIIKDGEFVKGMGGGICQVSSTLYNALLLSNIDVVEAHKHSLPVSYVKPGFDAMVSWGTADLKFANTTKYPIYIQAKATDSELTFSIFGDTNNENYTIKTRSEIVKTIKPEKDLIVKDIDGKFADKIMFKGEFFRTKYAKDGYVAKTYLDYYQNEKLVKSKLLRTGQYEAQRGILYEGTDDLYEGMTLPKKN